MRSNSQLPQLDDKRKVLNALVNYIEISPQKQDLGRTASHDGRIWDIVAVGPSAHASDRTVQLIYVDPSGFR